MITPAIRSCDFCTNVIEPGVHYAVLKVPIPPSVRGEMAHFIEEHLAPRIAHSPLGVMLGGVEHLVPDDWPLEVCVDCAFGILPQLRAIVIAQIRDSIERSLETRRRAAASLDNLEPSGETARSKEP